MGGSVTQADALERAKELGVPLPHHMSEHEVDRWLELLGAVCAQMNRLHSLKTMVEREIMG